jgi:hypothetical protein
LHPVSGVTTVLNAACAGALAGLVGTLAMNAAQRLWTIGAGDRPPESAAGPHDARDWQERDEGRNSNEIFAQTLATMVARPLSRRELAVAAPAVHFSFAHRNRLILALPKRDGASLFNPSGFWSDEDGLNPIALHDDINAALTMADSVIELFA